MWLMFRKGKIGRYLQSSGAKIVDGNEAFNKENKNN